MRSLSVENGRGDDGGGGGPGARDGKAKGRAGAKADAKAAKIEKAAQKELDKKGGKKGGKTPDSPALALLRRSAEWGGDGGLLPRLPGDCERLRAVVKTERDRRDLIDGVVGMVEDGAAGGGAVGAGGTGRGVLAKLLKVLYDGDVVEEEHLLAWADAGAAPEWAAAAAAPLITWLRQAASGSDDDDSD